MSVSLLSRTANQSGAEVLPDVPEVQLPRQGRRAAWEWTVSLEWLLVLLTALIAIALHLRFITDVGGLWRDEINSVHLATSPASGKSCIFSTTTRFPSFSSPYCGDGWGFLEQITIPLSRPRLHRRIRRARRPLVQRSCFGIRWPVLSLALIGLESHDHRYGDSTRGYGLGNPADPLDVSSLSGVWWICPRLQHSGRILLATGLALLSVHCLYYNSVLLLAIAAGTVAVTVRRRIWRTAGIVLGIGIISGGSSLLPYVPMMRTDADWTFMVSYPADFAWLWKRIGEVIGSPDAIGIWIWVGLCVVGLGVAVGVAVARFGARARSGNSASIG